ncbi:MAG: trypsin-like serine protease, partial [Deltaproteobacteria bacterium]|nr:trypsin-like serine protease [Deltaproteobacteria bacterium]
LGVVITKADLGRPAIPMNRTALGAANLGAPIRFVGYGKSVANDAGSLGTRRSAWLTVSAVSTGLVGSQGGGKAFTCNGDSGGPGLVTLGGVPRIVGVNSHGNLTCSGTNWSTRVDTFAASFVDPYISKFDPAWKPL